MPNFQAWKFWERDKIPVPAQHWERESYIPMKPQELARQLAGLIETESKSSTEGERVEDRRSDFLGKASRIAEWAHQNYREKRELLLGGYDRYDPDADAQFLPEHDLSKSLTGLLLWRR